MIKIKGSDRIIISSKKKKLTCFLDLDGVCADWTKSACKVCDIDPENEENRKKLKERKIEDIVGKKKLWKTIDEAGVEFWENLDLFPWTKEIINEIKKKTDSLCFLTAPSNNSNSVVGKMNWIKKHFKNIDFLIGQKKYYCANNNTLLIDDSEKKIKLFEEHGGNIFLFPNDFKLIDEEIDIGETIENLINKIDKLLYN